MNGAIWGELESYCVTVREQQEIDTASGFYLGSMERLVDRERPPHLEAQEPQLGHL